MSLFHNLLAISLFLHGAAARNLPPELPLLTSPWPTEDMQCPEASRPRGVHCSHQSRSVYWLTCEPLSQPWPRSIWHRVSGQCPTGYFCFAYGPHGSHTKGPSRPEEEGSAQVRVDCISWPEHKRRTAARQQYLAFHRQHGRVADPAACPGKRPRAKGKRKRVQAASVSIESTSGQEPNPIAQQQPLPADSGLDALTAISVVVNSGPDQTSTVSQVEETAENTALGQPDQWFGCELDEYESAGCSASFGLYGRDWLRWSRGDK